MKHEALGDPQRLAQCLAYLGNYFTLTCRSAQALEVCQRALAMATRHGEGVLQINAQYRVSCAYCNMGDFRQVIALLTETVESLTGELR